MRKKKQHSNPVMGIAHLLLQASNIESCELFYCGLLGLQVSKRTEFEKGRPLITTKEGIGLTTFSAKTDDTVENKRFNVEHIALWVSDLEFLVERLKGAGFQPTEPKINEYGKSSSVCDPDGNRIELIQDRKIIHKES